MAGYDEMTEEELREQLRDRDMKASPGQDERVIRLEDDDSAAAQRDRPAEDVPTGAERRPRRLGEVVARIRADFGEIAGLQAERITELQSTEDGWRAKVDVVELSRVPSSTDVLATYEVTADVDGSVGAFERVRRFRRSEAGGG